MGETLNKLDSYLDKLDEYRNKLDEYRNKMGERNNRYVGRGLPYQDDLRDIEYKCPHHLDWDEYAYIFNQLVPVKPQLVIIPENGEQVSRAVRWANKAGLHVQARSGGHSYASHSLGGKDGSVVMDLRKLTNIALDERSGIVRVGGGVRLGNIARFLWGEHGEIRRAVAHGSCPTVGIGGQFTHGGYGVTSRSWGLAMDHIVAMEVVMADGQILGASASENEDLFMAMRGAADSFGIAVNFYLRTHKVTEEVLKFNIDLSDTMETVESAVNTFLYIQNFVNFWGTRDLNLVVRIHHDRFEIEGVYMGDRDEFQHEVLSPFLLGCRGLTGIGVQFTSVDWLTLMEWSANGADLDTTNVVNLEPANIFTKSVAVSNPGLTRDELVSYFTFLLSNGEGAHVEYYIGAQLCGGMGSQINAHCTRDAYGQRNAMWLFQHAGEHHERGPFPEKGIRFIENLNKALGSRHGAVPNYSDPSLTRDEAHRLYYGEKIEELRQLKGKLDPKNVFSHPQSIEMK